MRQDVEREGKAFDISFHLEARGHPGRLNWGLKERHPLPLSNMGWNAGCEGLEVPPQSHSIFPQGSWKQTS